MIFQWFLKVFLIFDVFNISMDFKWILVRLERLLGTSWGVLGRLGDVLGASSRVLGASWPHLGASWSVLERLGHLQASKIEKSLKNQRKTIKNHTNINLI